jgi:hypothetical protein
MDVAAAAATLLGLTVLLVVLMPATRPVGRISRMTAEALIAVAVIAAAFNLVMIAATAIDPIASLLLLGCSAIKSKAGDRRLLGDGGNAEREGPLGPERALTRRLRAPLPRTANSSPSTKTACRCCPAVSAGSSCRPASAWPALVTWLNLD